jgi:hypothetical protein
MEVNIINGKTCSVYGLKRCNIVKMSISPKAMCRFNVILVIIPVAFFAKRKNFSLKLIWILSLQRTLNSQNEFEKEHSWRKSHLLVSEHVVKIQ